MAAPKIPAWAREPVERLRRIEERAARELDEFFSFPGWFPKPVLAGYRRAVRALLNEFERWPDAGLPQMRLWIDAIKTDHFDDVHVSFHPLEIVILHELAFYECAASLPPKEGLRRLSDDMAADGWQVQQKRKEGGAESGRARKENALLQYRYIARKAKQLLDGGAYEHELASQLSDMGLGSPPTIRRALQLHGLWTPPKKRK